MNYIHYKKKYPKTYKKFFEWVSNNYDNSSYKKNFWFGYFFTQYFPCVVYDGKYGNFFFTKNDEHTNRLKIFFPEGYREDQNTLYIKASNEAEFENLFFCLEILINDDLI